MLRALALTLFVVSAAAAQDPLQAGVAAFQKHDLTAARAAFEEASRRTPGDPAPWLWLARTFAEQKDSGQALAAARKAETLAGNNPAVLQALANLYSGAIPDPAKAADFGRRFAELSPQDQTVWRRLAAFCLSTHQPERAIEAATRGMAADNSAEMHGLLGQAYAETRQWNKAITELSEAVKLGPYDESAWFRLAQAYLLQPDFPNAVRVLEEARKTFDKSPQIELALGVAWYGQRDFPKAVDQFLTTIRLAPEVPQPYVFLGRMMEHIGDRAPEMIELLRQREAADSRDVVARVLHAKALVAQLPPSGFPPEAVEAMALVERALALKEDDADAHYLAGLLLERKGDFAAAATHLERSIALNPQDPAPHYRLARVYARLGRTADADRERELHLKLSEQEGSTGARGVAVEQRPQKP